MRLGLVMVCVLAMVTAAARADVQLAFRER